MTRAEALETAELTVANILEKNALDVTSSTGYGHHVGGVKRQIAEVHLQMILEVANWLIGVEPEPEPEPEPVRPQQRGESA